MAGTCLPNVYNLYGTDGDEMIDNHNEDYDMTEVEEREGEHLCDSSDDDDEDYGDGVDWDLYNKMVEESQGFDVPKLPVLVSGQIVPLTYLEGSMEKLIFCCELALKHYRENEGEDLRFVRVLKANAWLQGCQLVYYITFVARDSRRRAGVYQAKVYYRFLEKETSEVEVMRPRPEPADGASSSSPSFLQWVIMRLKEYRDSLW